MRSLQLVRDSQNEIRTFGTLIEGEPLICQTLELPWRDNAHKLSCIPEGEYLVKLMFSPAHQKDLYWITEVPGRGAIEIHCGNTVADTQGCVLLGAYRDGDAIRHSQAAFASFMTLMDGVTEFTLTISKKEEVPNE